MRTSHRSGVVERLEPRRLLSLSLLGDFNTTTVGSWAREPVGVGYFYADDGVHGHELWKTDGTPQGTSLAVDINPGPGGSGGFDLHEANGLLYFSGDGASDDVDMWRSDGTAAGTVQLTDVAGPSTQFLIENVASFNGAAVFGSYHHGLWRSDGTAAGTVRIAPVRARNIVRLGDALYFMGSPMPNGPAALWKTDGTAAGTMVVREFSSPWATTIFEASGRLYFWADDGPINGGFEPWSSDGTPEGTVPLGELVPGRDSSTLAGFAVFNDAVYFTATTTPDPYNRHKLSLFRTDGTAGSATLIANVAIGASAAEHGELIVYNDAMYFAGNDTVNNWELWRSDGTPQGTGQFIDLTPGPSGSDPRAFAIYNGRLHFKAETPEHGFEMYSTDGTVAGTRLLKDIAPGNRGIDSSNTTTPAVFNGRLFFRADDGVHGMELWSTDGTASGTTLLRDLDVNTNDFFPFHLTSIPFTAGPGGSSYFIADDGVRGSALWKTDGTAAGTSLVKGFSIVYPWGIGPFTFANGLLLFGAYDNQGGFELWRSDGTEAGTQRVKDIAPGNSSGLRGGPMIKVGERVFFLASSGTGNFPRPALWVSDGTEAGTRLVRPSDNQFTLSTSNFSGIDLNGRLVFLANTYPPAGSAIFISDGTLEGTALVRGGFYHEGGVSEWAVFSDKAYFTPTTIATGRELWGTDGTEAGTALVADIRPGTASSSPGRFVSTPDNLYFTATDGANGRELWRVNKHRAGPVRVTTLASDVVQVRASARGGVLFTTEPGQIYRFDGTNVIPLMASQSTTAPALLGAATGFDYFAAAGTVDDGTELWRTDGTPAGTVMLKDLNPGPASSWPQNLVVAGGRVLVSAYVPTVGRELFVLSPSASAPSPIAHRQGVAPAGRAFGWSSERIIDLVSDDPASAS